MFFAKIKNIKRIALKSNFCTKPTNFQTSPILSKGLGFVFCGGRERLRLRHNHNYYKGSEYKVERWHKEQSRMILYRAFNGIKWCSDRRTMRSLRDISTGATFRRIN